MDKITIQIQSVLYHNDIPALKKAICHIANAIRVYNKVKGNLECSICYGDASKTPIFTDTDIAEMEKIYPEILSINYNFFNENTGTAKGHNRLAAGCQSEFIMVMNPDVLVTPRFFIEMLKPFSDHCVGLTEARQTPLEHPKEYDTKTFETGWSTTACVIFTTKVYREVKGFDEDSFFMYCDDVDFSWRIRLAGYKLIYRPNAPVYHAKRLSVTGTWQPTEAERYYSAEAALFMAYKWSQDEILKKYLWDFKRSKEDIFNKAAKEFKRRQKSGTLPKQLDPNHNVAAFIDGEYAKHRFTM